MKEIKLIIDGKEVQLTEKQLKMLEIEVRQNPFKRAVTGDVYYTVNDYSEVVSYIENTNYIDQCLYEKANYFNDEAFANQVALRQLLYRKLLKFAYDNEAEDETEWDAKNIHYGIFYSCSDHKFVVEFAQFYKSDIVYFPSQEAAARAIEEVIKPFMKKHPEFTW